METLHFSESLCAFAYGRDADRKQKSWEKIEPLLDGGMPVTLRQVKALFRGAVSPSGAPFLSSLCDILKQRARESKEFARPIMAELMMTSMRSVVASSFVGKRGAPRTRYKQRTLSAMTDCFEEMTQGIKEGEVTPPTLSAALGSFLAVPQAASDEARTFVRANLANVVYLDPPNLAQESQKMVRAIGGDTPYKLPEGRTQRVMRALDTIATFCPFRVLLSKQEAQTLDEIGDSPTISEKTAKQARTVIRRWREGGLVQGCQR